MNKKKGIRYFLNVCLIVIVVLFCTSCSVQDTVENIKIKDGLKEVDKENEEFISLISRGTEHEFWNVVQQYAEKAALDYGVAITFEGPSSERAVNEQVELLKSCIQKSPKVLCISALDSKALEPYLEEAEEKGIAVMGFDSGIKYKKRKTLVATDEYKAANLAAEKMAKLIDYEGDVTIFSHSAIELRRRDGFMDGLKKYPKIKVVDVKYADGDVFCSTQKVKEMIEENPSVKGIFATNEGAAVATINAVEELKKEKQIKIIGFDSGIAQINSIKNGVENGAITQNPGMIGYKTVEMAIKIKNGEKVDEFIDTGFYWYDNSNIDDEEIRELLYE